MSLFVGSLVAVWTINNKLLESQKETEAARAEMDKQVGKQKAMAAMDRKAAEMRERVYAAEINKLQVKETYLTRDLSETAQKAFAI